jgi:hypothetical protein
VRPRTPVFALQDNVCYYLYIQPSIFLRTKHLLLNNATTWIINPLLWRQDMTTRIFLSALLLLAVIVQVSDTQAEDCITTANGEKVCASPGAVCMQSRHGTVYCSKPGGGVAMDFMGNVYCGPGTCAIDPEDKISCSSKPYGWAYLDVVKGVVCEEGCVQASISYCEKEIIQ